MSGIIGSAGSKSGVIGAGHDAVAGFRVHRLTSFTITSDSLGIVTWESGGVLYDIDGSFSYSTGKFTAKKAGKYFAQGKLMVGLDNTTKFASMAIHKNGENLGGVYNSQISSSCSGNSGAAGSTIFDLAAGDWIALYAGSSYGWSGATTYGDSSGNATYFSAIKIS